jgi:hypothetical protein
MTQQEPSLRLLHDIQSRKVTSRGRLAKKLAQRFPLRRLKLYQPILWNHPAYIIVVAVVAFYGGYRCAIFLFALFFPVQVEVGKPPHGREKEGCQILCIVTTYVADGFIV